MPVRDQNSVDMGDRLERDGSSKVRNPFAEQRIGHQANAVELEEHSRVPYVANHQ